MNPVHIDEFYAVASTVFTRLYAAFPVPALLLVEELRGPIEWDITGLPDRPSQACFESIVWLAAAGLLTYRSIEPRNIGVEGAVLTQQAFVLLGSYVTWDDGYSERRIDALKNCADRCRYDGTAAIIIDLLAANCAWQAPKPATPLRRGSSVLVDGIE